MRCPNLSTNSLVSSFIIGGGLLISGTNSLWADMKPKENIEYGVASWYGKKFHGRKTATGEIYNMHALTAAHRTAKLGSYVKITNLHNGKSINTRINDRGPVPKNRILDMSFGSAKALGAVEQGLTNIKLEFISK